MGQDNKYHGRGKGGDITILPLFTILLYTIRVAILKQRDDNMNYLRQSKQFITHLLGVDVYGLRSRIIRIIPRKKRQAAWFSYESIIQSIIEKHRIDLILDVGANTGQFTLDIREFYRGQVISFEPVVQSFTTLEKAAANDSNWYVVNCALGNESKEENINVYESNDFSSLLEATNYSKKHFGKMTASCKKELIQIRRLNDILDELPVRVDDKRILLKLDTQGYDLEVFRGSSNIRNNIVALQSEVSHQPIYENMPHWLNAIDEYEKAGFTLVGLFPITRDGLHYVESDCLMIKTS